MVPLSFAGRDFIATPSGALYWPEIKALLVADLHLEKASWFARFGVMLPPYDSHATLARLQADIGATRARSVYCLGDSFHDKFGCDRLSGAGRDLLFELTLDVEWIWITGNHDVGMIDRCGGIIEEELVIDDLVLRHQAESGETRPELSGHFHPKLRVEAMGRRVSRRCFVASDSKLILPAYGSLTGGLNADHPEILKAVGSEAAALVAISNRLLRFPIAA